MADIALTKLGTSDDYSLCKGFALWPGLGTVRAGISSGGNSHTLFDTGLDLVVFKIGASATAGLFMGWCGPAYGFVMQAQGSNQNPGLSLDLSNDVVQGGLFFGLTASAGLNFYIQRLTITWVWDGWHSGIRFGYENLLNITLNAQFDLVAILWDLIQLINDNSDSPNTTLQRVGTTLPNVLGSYGFFDTESGQMGSDGYLSFSPLIALPINLVSEVPELEAIDLALKAFLGGFSAGPVIGIGIPTEVQITGVQLSDGTNTTNYTVDSIDSGTLTGSTTDNEVSAPTSLAFTMTHTPALELEFGFFAQVTILKFLSLGAQVMWDLVGDFGIQIQTGSFNNTVSNTIGAGSTGRARAAAQRFPEEKIVEYVFAAPVSA